MDAARRRRAAELDLRSANCAAQKTNPAPNSRAAMKYNFASPINPGKRLSGTNTRSGSTVCKFTDRALAEPSGGSTR